MVLHKDLLILSVYFPFKQANFCYRLLNFNVINFEVFLLSSFMNTEDYKTTVDNAEEHFKECLSRRKQLFSCFSFQVFYLAVLSSGTGVET